MLEKVKKGAATVAIAGLTIGLAGCGQSSVSKSDEKGTTTLTDILNSKKERPIVYTMDNEDRDNEIQWAGTIGNGKIDAHPTDSLGKVWKFDDVKNLDMKEFKKELKKEDKEASENQDLTVKTGKEKAKTILYSRDGKETKATGFEFNTKHRGDPDVQDKMKYVTAESGEGKSDGWLTIRDKDSNYVIKVKADKNEKNIGLEDVKKAKKQYDNVKVNKPDSE